MDTKQSGPGKLKASETRYRRLFEAAQDGILILDAQTGMIDDVNPFLIAMLGYSRRRAGQTQTLGGRRVQRFGGQPARV